MSQLLVLYLYIYRLLLTNSFIFMKSKIQNYNAYFQNGGQLHKFQKPPHTQIRIAILNTLSIPQLNYQRTFNLLATLMKVRSYFIGEG